MAAIASRRPARLQAWVLASLVALAAGAWVLTRNRMAGMDAGPGTDPGALGFYVLSWVVMMAAMMFPSIAPMVMAFAFVQRRRRDRGVADRSVSTWVFVAGYLIAWTAFGLAAYGIFVGLRELSPAALSWHRGGPYVAAAILLAAAAYQLTPAKNVCLRRCRGTLDFILREWRDGASGALRMGIVHGAWCVGCCWALMAALFALGVMSVTWMIVIAGLIAVEKLLPSRRLANSAVAVVLVVLGLAVALVPQHVPGLTIPGSAAATRAMQSMPGMHAEQAKPGMPAKRVPHGPQPMTRTSRQAMP